MATFTCQQLNMGVFQFTLSMEFFYSVEKKRLVVVVCLNQNQPYFFSDTSANVLVEEGI